MVAHKPEQIKKVSTLNLQGTRHLDIIILTLATTHPVN